MILNMHTTSSPSILNEAPMQNRIDEILQSYWDMLRGTRPYPHEADIEPAALSTIWNSCFLIKLSASEIAERGYRYTYLGTDLIEAFGDDVTLQEVSTRLIDPASASLMRQFEKVAQAGIPVTDEAEFTNKHGVLIKYRSCIVPLGEKPDHVDYLLGGMKWKAF